MKKVRKYQVHKSIKRIQVIVVMISIFTSFIAIGYNVVDGHAAEKNLHSAKLVEYCVEKGDTLWGIANSTKFNSLDTREVIDYIQEVNHISSANISTGDIILIPITK